MAHERRSFFADTRRRLRIEFPALLLSLLCQTVNVKRLNGLVFRDDRLDDGLRKERWHIVICTDFSVEPVLKSALLQNESVVEDIL